MKHLIFMLFLGLLTTQAQRNIAGTIRYDKAPLEGVSIRVNDNQETIFSNEQGYFSFESKEGDFVCLSREGMEELRFRIDDVTQLYTLEMTPEVMNLQEVVISKEGGDKKPYSLLNKPLKFKTAFGFVSPNEGYATRYISNEQIQQAWAAGIGKEGIASFLSYRALLRKSTTFGLTTSILWDVDGFIYNELPDIDIAMVEDILVLRGLAATTLYGSQAGAGVIAIRTKNQIRAQRKEKVEEKQYNKILEEQIYQPASYLTAYPSDQNALASQIDLLSNNPEALKRWAYYLDFKGHKGLAVEVYREILMQRSSYAQSFRDLAQAYKRAGNIQAAWDTYMKYITRGMKIDRSDGIEGMVYDEIWQMEQFDPIKQESLQFFRISDRYSEQPPQPIRFVVEWVNPLDAFDISFVNPNKQKATYEHRMPGQQKEILKEQTKGYSARSFYLDRSIKGSWSVNATALGKDDQPLSLKVTKYENWGTKSLQESIYYFDLKPGQGTQNLLNFTIQ